MNCPSCGAPMQLKPDMDSFKCEFCHSVFVPNKDEDGVRVLGKQTDTVEETCPVCNTALMLAAIAEVRILYCTGCHGMLIPMQTFQTIVAGLKESESGTTVQPSADSSDLRRKIDCPQCHHAMDTHLYAGPGNVVMDSCDQCEVNWLDHGELMHIVHAPGNIGPPEFSDAVNHYDDIGGISGAIDPFAPAGGYYAASSIDATATLIGTIASLFER